MPKASALVENAKKLLVQRITQQERCRGNTRLGAGIAGACASR